jgi:hypothetical protein
MSSSPREPTEASFRYYSPSSITFIEDDTHGMLDHFTDTGESEIEVLDSPVYTVKHLESDENRKASEKETPSTESSTTRIAM